MAADSTLTAPSPAQTLAALLGRLGESPGVRDLVVGLPPEAGDYLDGPFTCPVKQALALLTEEGCRTLASHGFAQVAVSPPGVAGGWRAAFSIPIPNSTDAVLVLSQDQPVEPGLLERVQAETIPMLSLLVENVALRLSGGASQAGMEALRNLSLQISACLDIKEVFEQVVQATLKLLPADVAHIYVCPSDDREAEPRFEFGAALWRDGRRTPAVSQPRPDGLTASAYRQCRPVVIDQAAEHPLYQSGSATDWGVHAIAAYPLMRGGHRLGVFTVSFLRPHRFTQEERRLLSLFADQAAVAVENARAAQKQSQQLAEMTLLSELAKKTAATLDFEETLEIIVRLLRSFLGCYAVSIMLLDAEGGLRMVANDGLPEDVARQAYLNPGQGIGGQVVATGCPIYIPDVRQGAGYLPLNPKLVALLVVPLIVKGQVIGTLSLDSETPGAFDAETERLMTIAAAQVASTIANVRLYQGERRRADELNTLLALSRSITRSLALDQIFDAAYYAIQHLMPAEAFFITLRDRQTDDSIATYLIDKGVRYPPVRWPENAGLSGWIIKTGQSVLVHDLEKEPLPVEAITYGAELDEGDVRSILAVPLRFGAKVSGMVSTQSYSPSAYSQHDLQLLQGIADHLAIAVEHANLYADLEKRFLSLQELDRMRHEFTQNVSHELRTPLTFLRSYVDLLLDGTFGELNEEQRQSLKIVQSKTGSLVRLVEDITLLQTNQQDWLRFQPVDLVEIARESVVLAEKSAAQHGIVLELQAPEQFPQLAADPNRLAQVFDNLLDNALKFGLSHSRVVVTVAVQDGEARVSVANEGDQIPPAEQARIFERFYQVDGSAARRQNGMGLGLAIVKNIIEGHGGRIWVHSEEPNRNTFTFTLPLR